MTPSRSGNHAPLRDRRRAGLSLLEVMLSLGLSMILITAVMSSVLFMAKSSLLAADQTELNLNSRLFLQQFAADVKGSLAVASATANSLELTLPDGSGTTPVTYAYDAGAGTTTRVAGGTSKVLLKDLTSFAFRIYNTSTTETTILSEVRIVEARFSSRRTSLVRPTPEPTTINARYFRRLAEFY